MKTIAILGTTASAKSALSHEIALKNNMAILSLDSLCIYKQLNIVSAKVDKKMLNELSYFGIDIINLDSEFNVALFFNEYLKAKEHCIKHNKDLLICGGSAFYLYALMQGLAPKIEDVKIDISFDEIYNLMQELDKESVILKNDNFRLLKWYSIYKRTNEIPSLWLKNNTKKALISDIDIFELCWEKELLNERIVQRTNKMFDDNVLDEVINLYKEYKDVKALQCIGAKEIIQYYKKEIKSIDELKELIVIHTRQFAKRQRTFNNKFLRTKLNIKSEKDLQQIYKYI
ncbi:tRNA (adenosine(37)-N6)-dimethylallyltransferase MiaA [Campylobacter canadensis]|uniref:tRNA dimethylallyltransferase n=1 Tax=Campylobacter canadensis TaxID=449520 RepID=A0ABS7WRU4_9BACT|nr:tRNA (adenosine(37)-N6)-dimethylallyltransferase MiaA [Campylobacter canadensis]MBZ7987096.1 tRNA (adenosine(37)-N6)-dimethylallyltransferase MiaA [Campylobacter canadensis]MBZ7994710.1 tRNA (adenosine(37)-N6)-dimethylallyltransferase MiaA [Campylobacter canadensis]MBZ7996206.1 tRNA (adenosine(37)-N6)-dimethylallyltransferase MiaA [Campylobacter canadensis]MBZ7998132.1 tRNA (adenosine(37)-N6)-dimethylallyltransferase MiaA [Campylobacter canadensis]MBZ7999978.1 tRNA (adenosine(37)-N6)-dimeth